MLPIRGLYEVAIPVRQLRKAEEFYRGVLGLEFGLRDDPRNWLFLRAGGAGMIVLQERDGEFRATTSPSRSASPMSNGPPQSFVNTEWRPVAPSSTTGSRARPSTSRTPTATNWSCSRPLRNGSTPLHLTCSTSGNAHDLLKNASVGP